MTRLIVTYHVTANPGAIEARARAIANEQSVEVPLEAVHDDFVRETILARVDGINELSPGLFEVRIALSAETTGHEAGQLINMLFGNTSLHDDVSLADCVFPEGFALRLGGPNLGLDGLRGLVNAKDRALTCTALKPQGLSAQALAGLSEQFALGGLDYIKDDHGLANQAYAPFAIRVAACGAAVARANERTGGNTRYVPSLSGNLDALRMQVKLALKAGCDVMMAAPMLIGLPAFHTLTREFPQTGFFAHPAMAGAARIAPPFLLGKLFRLLGADVTIFPNFGGRFGHSRETCLSVASAARGTMAGLKACVPAPAGGMSLARVPEMLDFYGPDTMLLIGGSLLMAGTGGALRQAAQDFTAQVATHEYVTRHD
jgi:ribulose-bisphosphate carboxylase large chain